MKIASAAGFSTATVANITVDDVKASDSDQVTISLDVDGQRKYTMDADYLDWIQRATSATEEITNSHFRKSSVHSIGTIAGDGEENPHVAVTLDRTNENANEDRGHIPEEKNGVEVRIHENDGETEPLCDEEDMDCINENMDFPGGQPIVVRDNNSEDALGPGTISTQIIESGWDWFGCSTAAHGFKFESNCNSSAYVYHETGLDYDEDDEPVHNYECYSLGSGDFVDVARDIAFINMEDVTETDWNINPSNHNEGVQINGTLSEEGVAAIADEYDGESKMHNYGAGSCHRTVNLHGWNQTIDVNEEDGWCSDKLYDQLIMTDGCIAPTGPLRGDSGSIWFTPDPETDAWWAVGSVAGSADHDSWCQEWCGPQGFSIDEVYGRAWR